MQSKTELFDIYSNNLYLVTKGLFGDESKKDSYICPVCLRLFYRQHLKPNNNIYLTEEHIPPKSVKWKRKVLTCNQCNTKQGGVLDSQLPIVLNTRAFLRGQSGTSLDSDFLINNEIKTAGTTKIGVKGTYHFDFDPKRTSPKDNDRIKTILKEGNKTPDIKVNYKTGKLKNALISVIRAAYLWAFSQLGYGFVFSENLNIYRQLILDSDDSNDHLKKVLEGQFPEGAQGVNIITEPAHYGCYLIIIEPTLSNYSQKLGVLLPGNTSKGFDFITNINCTVKGSGITYECKDLNNIDIIQDDELCLFPFMYWREKYGI